MVRIRPLDDRVVIQVLEAEEKTAGGILLPDAAREKPQQGTVVARSRRLRRAQTAASEGRHLPASARDLAPEEWRALVRIG